MSAWTALLQELPSPWILVLVGFVLLMGSTLVWMRRPSRRVSQHAAGPLSDPGWQAREPGSDLLQTLVEAIQADPDRVVEYLELGRLFRQRGDCSRAAQVLRQLSARPTLERSVRLATQYELGLSYRAMGLYELAVSTLEGVLRADPRHREARRALRHTHEEMGRWEQAVAVEKVRLKRGEASDQQTLAALRTQQGKAAWAAGHVGRSAAHLRAALALDPQATEARLLLARLWLQQGKLRQAERIWKELGSERAEFLYLAFRDMQVAFRRFHQEGSWELFLRAFTERHPDDPTGHLALAEWYESQGQPTEAIAALRQALESDPLCQEAHLALLTLYRNQGTPAEVCETYEMLVQASSRSQQPHFRCRACGSTTVELFWKCPGCQIWATPERLLRPSGRARLAVSETVQDTEHANGASGPMSVARQSSPQPF